jgi:PAS domain S-box-containing protein
MAPEIRTRGPAFSVTDARASGGPQHVPAGVVFPDLQAALADLPVGADEVTAMLDEAGLVVSISPNCEQLLGYSDDELIGTYAHDLLHPDDLRALAPATRAFADGLTDHVHSVQRLHHKHLGYALVETTVRATRPADGGPPAGAVVVASAPEAPDRPAERPMVSFAPAAIGTAYAWITPGSRRAVLASADPVFAALVGSTTVGLVGRPLEELTDPQSPEVGQARLLALLDGSSGTYQVERAVSESQGHVELTVSLMPLPDKPGHTAVIQARDTTRQREADRAARDSLTALERSNRDLQAFATVAAHDLAAPLRVVVGYAEMLAQGGPDCSPQMAELLEKVASTSRRMQAQVDGLMLLARVEDDELPTGQYDIHSLLEEALEPLQSEIERQMAVLDVGALPIVVCNATGVIQVFANLITNALKYGGTHPQVSVQAVRASGAWQFTVADRGIGLPEGDERQLFELFERGPGVERLAGAGIGLAVCRRIVTRHEGRIWCTRRAGGGSEFHFTLPDRQPDAGSPV